MESATISTRTLEIDGMSGDACVQKVTNALKHVHGVSTQSVKVGSATIGADPAGFKSACAAVAGSGYKVRDGNRAAESKDDKSCDQARSTTQNQAGNAAGASKTSESPNTNGAPKPVAAKA